MSSTYNIDHAAVNERASQLRNELLNEFASLELEYNIALNFVYDLDSATHAELVGVIELKKQKAARTSLLLVDLLAFMEDAAERFRQVDELRAASIVRLPHLNRPRGGVTGIPRRR